MWSTTARFFCSPASFIIGVVILVIIAAEVSRLVDSKAIWIFGAS
jgi:hypothetical protein